MNVVQPNELLRLRDVVKNFGNPAALPLGSANKVIHAVNGISLSVNAGETVGIVGESGCGKTTVARLLLRLESPTKGSVLFRGVELAKLSGSALKQYRKDVQAVFQDPWGSLNPKMRIWEIVGEPLIVNRGLPTREVKERAATLLEAVGLQRYVGETLPGSLSGGIRQRVAIARALSVAPAAIVLDEPLSSLDASVQAGVMNLLRDLQREYGVSYVLISHDFLAVRYLADRVAVMYLGQIVEEGRSEEVLSQPLHPYTQMLVAARARFGDQKPIARAAAFGEVPSPTSLPLGCRFHPRCQFAMPKCSTDEPRLGAVSEGRKVACHLYETRPEVSH